MTNEKLKQLSSLLRYYIGCKCNTLGVTQIYTLQGINGNTAYLTSSTSTRPAAIDTVYPILRPMDDMDENEAIQLMELQRVPYRSEAPTAYRNTFKQIIVSYGPSMHEKYMASDRERFTPAQIDYLLSCHFDIFNMGKDYEVRYKRFSEHAEKRGL